MGHGTHRSPPPAPHLTWRVRCDSLSHVFSCFSVTTTEGVLSPILLVGKNETRNGPAGPTVSKHQGRLAGLRYSAEGSTAANLQATDFKKKKTDDVAVTTLPGRRNSISLKCPHSSHFLFQWSPAEIYMLAATALRILRKTVTLLNNEKLAFPQNCTSPANGAGNSSGRQSDIT